MSHTAEAALTRELETIVQNAADTLSDKELAEREKKANEIVEAVRDRVARRERA